MILFPPAGFVCKFLPLFARLFVVLGGCAGLALMSGCSIGGIANDGGPNQVFILKETPSPQQIVVEKGAQPPTARIIEVNGPTPPPKLEEPGKQPSPKHVWMAGSWRFYSGRYVWAKGQWALPPKPDAVYTPPSWEIVNGNHVFTEGYWHF
jgi:hypothetical protein